MELRTRWLKTKLSVTIIVNYCYLSLVLLADIAFAFGRSVPEVTNMMAFRKLSPLLAAWLVLATFEPQVLAVPPEGPSDVTVFAVTKGNVLVLTKAIAHAMRTNPELRGAWLHFDPNPGKDPGVEPGSFTFRRVLDQSRAEVQKAEMKLLIESCIPEGNYEIDEQADKEYPFSELLADIQLAVDLDPRMAGCMIVDGYYAPGKGDPDRLDLRLRGRYRPVDTVQKGVVEDPLIYRIERLCGDLMVLDMVWIDFEGTCELIDKESNRTREAKDVQPNTNPKVTELEDVEPSPVDDAIVFHVSPKLEELKRVEPSPIHGEWFFCRGLQSFWKHDYRAAAELFRLANLESERKISYYYWQVLCDILVGDTERAFERMCRVIDVYNVRLWSSEHKRVFHSLERVQGPLRTKLQDLELQAMNRVRTKGKRPAEVAYRYGPL